jgi:uncharacterized protein YraI
MEEEETPAADLAAPAREPALRSTISLVNDLRVRSTPSTTAPVVTSIREGTPVEILAGSANADGLPWARVRITETTVGWVVATALR